MPQEAVKQYRQTKNNKPKKEAQQARTKQRWKHNHELNDANLDWTLLDVGPAALETKHDWNYLANH